MKENISGFYMPAMTQTLAASTGYELLNLPYSYDFLPYFLN